MGGRFGGIWPRRLQRRRFRRRSLEFDRNNMITDPIPFLANIILVAHANGSLSVGENGQLEAIRSEFDIKKGDFSKAIKLVEQGHHQLTPVGSFADQVKNLECILRVAYADDELEAREAELVSAFCQTIGIYQDQLDKLVAGVLILLANLEKLCSSCGDSAAKDAKFCPKCGAPLTVSNETIQLDFEIPAHGLAIEFAESSAASFARALELAKSSDSYQSCQKLKKTWHLAIFKSGMISDALPLAEALSGIRNRRAFFHGAETAWEELFGFTWCTSQRATAYRPVEYCFGKDENRINPWGCKQARMDWVEWSDWFSYGRWEKGGMMGPRIVWRFDKDRIRHELATRLFRFRFCPFMNTTLSEAVLRVLPDTVAPEKDKNWKYNQNYEETPGAIKVIEREGSGDYTYTNEFWSDGVRPVGHRVLAEILNAAFKEAGVNQTSAQALLK